MTYLDKMQLSGIRLFSPNEPQAIKFCPLTLILGSNGAGKTTLIEAMRYATSGEAPPGSDKGKLWISDPALFDQIGQVRGQVKLKFRASDGVMTEVSRSMELLTKKDRSGKVSQQFKTLDSTIVRFNTNGEKETLSSRCAKIDDEMLSLVGVSKAVLTNVIFCHQEDNCWPLSEGKVLKEKFDQIFGSMGYVKALAKIKSYRAKKVSEFKALEAVRDKFHEIRGQKGRNEKEKTRHTKELEQLRVEKTNLENKLKPIEAELLSLSRDESASAEGRSRVSRMKGQLQEKVRSAETLSQMIKDKFEGSLAELDLKEDAFRTASGLADKSGALAGMTVHLNGLENELTTSVNRLNALLIQKGKVNQQEENYRSDVSTRSHFLSRQRDSSNDTLDDDSKSSQLLGTWQSKISQLQSEWQDSDEESAIKQLTKESDDTMISIAKAQQTIKMKEETQHKRESEMKQLLAKVTKVELTAGAVVDCSDEILEAVKDLRSKLSNESDADVVEEKVSNLKVSQCDLQEEVMELKKMNHQLVRENVSSVSEIRKEVKDLEDGLHKVRALIAEKKESRRIRRETTAAETSKYQNLIRQLEQLNSNVSKHTDISERSARLKQETDGLNVKVDKIRGEKMDLELKIQAVQKEVSEYEITLRNFSDNRRFLIISDEIAQLNEKVVQEEEKLPVMENLQVVERKKQELKKKEDRLKDELGRTKGLMQSAQNEVRRLENELRQSKYETVERDFKKAVVDLVTLELLNEDLNKYYKVLDQAVSKYHVKRMEQINQWIGHYWRITYQGSDIKTIKIVCDSEEERTADKRRSFNYRVVMVKEKTEMDMRGRCSAGQKVLASLVIRIALAQTFCVKCSILTLDEPTTNLDKANIEALARAICNIVSDQNGKVQLVIITHDSEFLKYLDEEFSEFYYEIFKENNFSRIKRNYLRDRE